MKWSGYTQRESAENHQIFTNSGEI